MTRELVTVIGGSGFIGRYVVRNLARHDRRIRIACRHPNEALFLKPLGNVGQVQLSACNVRNKDSIARAVHGSSAVINLVGILQPGGHQDFESVHKEGAGEIARAAREAGVQRLVHMSAIGADRRSESAYARTKGEGEAEVRAAFPSATIFRPSIVFGPEDDFFNRFARMAQIAPALPLIGGGRTRFQPVYVCDVADALVAAAVDGGAAGRTYELGGPRVYTFREILELVLAETRRKRPLVPVPFGVAKMMGLFAGILPNAPITADQVEMLKQDNVVSPDALTLQDLGIDATPAESVVGGYLRQYRRHGGADASVPETA
jgi:NADH dehydrogenase